MKKTVNQWLDLILSLPEHRRNLKEVHSFEHKLKKIKMDSAYAGYGGAVVVEINDELIDFLIDLN